MKTAHSFLLNNRRLFLGASLGLVLLSAACGDDSEPDDGNVVERDASTRDAQGTQPRDDASAPPTGGGSPTDAAVPNPVVDGSKADSGNGGGTADSLFKDALECEEGSRAIVRVEGTIDGKPISYEEKGVSSLVSETGFNTVNDTDVSPPLSWVSLRWEEPMLTVPAGTVLSITRGWLNFSRAESGAQGNYCMVSGRFGAAPKDQQPGAGSRYYFEVDSVKMRDGDISGSPCTGPDLPAKIKGCVYRTVR